MSGSAKARPFPLTSKQRLRDYLFLSTPAEGKEVLEGL